MDTHLYRNANGNDLEDPIVAWTGKELADHFRKPNALPPEVFAPFIRNKTLTVARDHHDNILISISLPTQVGAVHSDDYLMVVDGKLYAKYHEEFEKLFVKVVPPEPEKLVLAFREDLELQRCTRPNCKQPAKFTFQDDARGLPVFRCPQHLVGDICWDALSATEVENLRKLGA